MSKEIYISSTPHETRLAIVENDALTEIYYERENEYTLAGSIYNGKVTRVLPGMQSSFVDIGLERDAFLYITDFMEEAGDSADFEASANGNDHARAPRGEAGREERNGRADGAGRSERADRDAKPRTFDQPRSEPTDAELFTEAVSGLDPARPVSDNERGARRGGRGRRDRALNSDGTPRRDREARDTRAESSRPDANAADLPTPPPLVAATPRAADEVGEGAPGADGSRRWRGRRGRRGTRGRDEAGEPGQGVTPAEREPSATTGPVFDAYPEALPEAFPEAFQEAFQEPGEAMESFNPGVFAALPSPLPDTSAPRAERGSRTPADDRGGRERTQRERGQQQPRRVPRGFVPSLSLYQVESAAEEQLAPVYGAEPEDAPPSEPIILPGESLSKYRAGGSDTSSTANGSSAAPASPPVPAAEFIAEGWDGGFVLPGETLRPRGPAAGSARESTGRDERPRGPRDGREPRSGDRGRNDRGGRGDRDRAARPDLRSDARPEPDATRDRSSRPDRSPDRNPNNTPDRNPDSDRTSPQASSFTPQPEAAAPATPTYLTDPETVPASHLVTPLNSTFIAPPPLPQVPDASAQHDYEPAEASASYRVDPVPPSEFRQSAPVLESAAFAEPAFEATEPAPEAPLASTASDPADLHTVSDDLHRVLAAQDLPAQDFPLEAEAQAAPHAYTANPDAQAESSVAPASHQLTSISDSGEMHSVPPFPEATLANASPQQELAEPSSPIYHEAAVVDVLQPAEPFKPVEPFKPAEPVQSAAFFAPGSGLLEEEMLDDEDDSQALTLPGLQAARGNGFHDQHEHQDQETLESVADLGTMLREMSIDQITSVEPLVDEEEDLDEDFLEEDQDYDDSESEEDELQADEPDSSGQSGEAKRFHEQDEPGQEIDELENSEYGSGFEGERTPRLAEGSATQPETTREPRRDGNRNDRGRRDGRRGERGRRPGSGERSSSPDRSPDRAQSDRGSDRSASDRGSDRSSSDRSGGRREGRGGRQSMQSTNLPAISELLKPGQEILCQIAKEPIAKKGARITSHIALPGRFLVFMPTVSHTGVSRKIESDGERRRLKEILLSEKGEAAGGFIVRTAAAGATEEELRSDLRFLLNLWSDIKTRSESSKSPALIYHDLNLVERVLRDQVTDTFSAIWVDTESEYERVLRFLQRFQPSLIRRVKLYTKETPLFEQFGITEEINKALRSKVWLKSGGSIVINQTEALVAIDINTGKFVGKTARLEDTIVKTNLDAIPEIVRQIRLRDLGGIIIIDFIDMDERKNRNKVMAALEEELKSDRAPSKVLQFNDFGLVAITRKRVKQSLERTLSTTCGICAGTGMVKSPVTVCNDIYIEMRKMHRHLERGDVMLRVNPEVVKQLKSTTSRWLQEMEEMVGKTILVKSDPSLHPEQFDIQ